MFALNANGRLRVLSWMGGARELGLLALCHALLDDCGEVLGDDPECPASVLLVRENEGGDRLDAHGAGWPRPAVAWLVGRSREVKLLAPSSWDAVVRDEVVGVSLWREQVTTWSAPDPECVEAVCLGRGAVVRRLDRDDKDAFQAIAPNWALRAWGSYEAMLERGSGFGVPVLDSGRLASAAWIFDQTDRHDALAVATDSRFRRLGLGRTAAAILIEHVLRERRKIPLWSAHQGNVASHELARSLGFTRSISENLWCWTALRRPR